MSKGVRDSRCRGERSLSILLVLSAMLLLVGGSRAASAQDEAKKTHEEAQPSSQEAARPQHRPELEEVAVVGTQIRGSKPIGAVVELDRKALEVGGFETVGEALRSLPMNLSGGINEQTKTGNINADGASGNLGRASSVNLFGIGSGATLVLLNGRRLPVGTSGESVDLSTLPLSAVENIEVLTGGASAIYGADAVAGVVNVVTRRELTGFEGRIRYGAADGGHDSLGGSVLQGIDVGSFSGVVGLEVSERSPLYARDRLRSRDADDPTTVINDEDRVSAYFAGDYELTPRVRLFADGIYHDRDQHEEDTALVWGETYDYYPKVSGYASAAGVEADVGDSWSVEFFGTLAETTTKSTSILNVISTGEMITIDDSRFDSSLWSVEVRATGDLIDLPGGPARIAIGSSYRDESFTQNRSGSLSDTDRSVLASYVELDVPVVGTGNSIPLVDELRLKAAARYEDYSDFGSITTPSVGLTWTPFPDFELQMGYSESFRAPSSFDRAEYHYTYLEDLVDGAGLTRVLLVDGTGRALEPETAENITFGVTFAPSDSGFQSSLLYFQIEYDDRIAHPDPSYAYSFSNLTNAPSQLINRSPTAAEIQALVDAGYFNGSAVGPPDYETVEAILDIRKLNVASTSIEGLQGHLGQSLSSSVGQWDLSLDVTYLFDFTDQLFAGDPEIERVDTIYSPVDLRGRFGTVWSNDRWVVGGFLNYVDDYVDNRVVGAPIDIDSWTTVDLSVAFDLFESDSNGRGGTRIQFSVSDLFDEAPPEILPSGGSTRRFRWDPTNASVRGRFASLEIVQRW